MACQNFNYKDYQPITYEKLDDMGEYALGLKLLVTCYEHSFVGVCNHILRNSKEIVLEQVFLVGTGKPLFGLLFLFVQDILKIHIIGINPNARKRLQRENFGDKNKEKVMKQILPPSSVECLDEDESMDEFQNENNPVKLLPNFTCDLIKPTEWKIIDSFGEDFTSAVNNIYKDKMVSISGSGLSLGRRGTLAWLAVDSNNFTYLFDVAKLGVSNFLKSEVGKIIDDSSFIKIIHNGRKLDDYLFHQHGLTIENTFDTQASDIYLHTLKAKDQPYLVKNLSLLLEQYLNISSDKVALLFPTIEDESMWLERPLPDALVVFLIHSVMFLKDLRNAMMKLVLFDLKQINKVFMASLRTKPSNLADNIEELLVPMEVLKLIN